ncbi:hypothetical protein [Sabulicella glaciei]|uniref:Phage protein D n=1 Tax=Sabulicella glaciei TaxID=2984948 RepID=A0ABT3NQ35_9PROT|nr:hypothetical protein [Roseococcus sp. MDT2-1-1]MCW8084273.1 hypothetical protein [Roseococcus sp. MDT2-1-1]
MLEGVHLTLMIGPAVPVPAPRVVMDALRSISVTSGKDRSGFQVTFAVGRDSPLLNVMLPAGYFDPITTRVLIIATVNGFPHVLMDGLVTQQELSPSNEPGQSTLSITGEDLSLAMDLVETVIPYPQVPLIARIRLILAKYAALGCIPAVIPTIIPVTEVATSGFETQTTTDRAYLKSLARRAGYVFYVEPGPAPGTSVAYFGPDIRVPIPQSALNIDMDAATNVESLSFSLDGLAKKLTVVTILDPVTGKVPIPIPIPNVNIFKPPLGLRPTAPARLEFNSDYAKLKPDKAAEKILGLLMNNAEAITASGSLDVVRYGRPLRSRALVGVRGAGLAYDGLYYVDTVTHKIKPGEYKQSFTLSRDGLISNTPKVVP